MDSREGLSPITTPEAMSTREVKDPELNSWANDLATEFGIPENQRNEITQAIALKIEEEKTKALETDAKFDILNSVGLHRALEEAIKISKERNLPLTGAFLDLEGLRAVNNKLGQDAGDKAIKIVVESLNANSRSSDIQGRVNAASPGNTAQSYESKIAAREGGDEFVLLYVGTDLKNGILATQRLMEVIANNSDKEMPEHRNTFGRPLGSRAGIAQFDESVDQDGSGFLRRIGGAMYMAKRREGKMGVSGKVYNEGDYNTVIVRSFNKPQIQTPAGKS